MKTLWNFLAVLAVANVLAVGGLLAFLAGTDRLSVDRMRAVRALLTPTIAQDAQRAREEEQRVASERAAAEEARRAARPPLTAEELLASRVELSEIERQRLERLRRELDDLRTQLSRDKSEFETARAAFRAEVAAFTREREESERRANDAQFRKTLDTLAQLKAPAAAAILTAMMEAAPADFVPATLDPARVPANPAQQPQQMREGGRREVVELLNAMEDRQRARIIDEFRKQDPELAAQLLESLRRRGQVARVDESP